MKFDGQMKKTFKVKFGEVSNGDYNKGYNDGYALGYEVGFTEGEAKGHSDGYKQGYNAGLVDGENNGYTKGYNEGYAEGYAKGVESKQAEIDDISAALDDIIAIQYELLGTIPFSIYYDGDGNTVHLEAEEGMTWGEWCESEYNTIGAYVTDICTVWHDYNGDAHQIYHTLDNETGVFTDAYASDVIERHHKYLCVSR